ncbi:unnamed protein product [Arctogadus glacialis]
MNSVFFFLCLVSGGGGGGVGEQATLRSAGEYQDPFPEELDGDGVKVFHVSFLSLCVKKKRKKSLALLPALCLPLCPPPAAAHATTPPPHPQCCLISSPQGWF